MNTDNLQKNHFKESFPDETVLKIITILQSHQIFTEEVVPFSSEIGTSSTRLVIQGTNVGSNGKGITPNYARASAYAEFMERLENQHLNSFISSAGLKKQGFYLYPDERLLSAEDLIAQKDPFLSFYFSKMGIPEERRSESFLNLHRLDALQTGQENCFISLPFWDCKSSRIVYLPYNVYRPWYGSNGMCAGNTAPEALVQGLSEIFERIVMKRLFQEQLCFPEIPDQYLKKHPYIYDRVEMIRQNPNYDIHMLDCSLGGKFPVAGLLIIEKNTGNYGLKFGCHPDYTLAMERTLTEATQSQNIDLFAQGSYLDFSNENTFTEINLGKCLMTGDGQYPCSIFSCHPSYPFTEFPDVRGKTNEEFLLLMLEQVQREGYHVLLRDVSYLGFPAYHILIPGLSEAGTATARDYQMLEMLNRNVEKFRHPASVKISDVPDLICCLEHYSYRPRLSFFMRTECSANIPWENVNASADYYRAVCFLMVHDFKNAVQALSEVGKKAAQYPARISQDELERLHILIYYASARQNIPDHDHVIHHLQIFFDESLCLWVDDLFSNVNLLLEKLFIPYSQNETDQAFETAMDHNLSAMIHAMPSQEKLGHLLKECHNTALYREAQRYRKGEQRPQDYPKAIALFEQLAAEGDVRGEYMMGLLYFEGEGVAQDYQKALYWHTKAGRQGYKYAQYSVGIMYENGWGTPPDNKEAFRWHHMAAMQEYGTAQYRVACHYYFGLSVKKDIQMAKYWFEKSAKNGFIESKYNLACLLAEEENVDWSLVISLWTEAAQTGHFDSICNLALCSLYHCGMDPSCAYIADLEHYVKKEDLVRWKTFWQNLKHD